MHNCNKQKIIDELKSIIEDVYNFCTDGEGACCHIIDQDINIYDTCPYGLLYDGDGPGCEGALGACCACLCGENSE